MIQIPLIAKVLGAGAGLWFLRGKTADLGAFTDAQASEAAKAICAELGGLPPDFQTPRTMAQAIGKAAYTVNSEGEPVELDWPPKWLATKTHKAVWAQMLAWCELIREAADDQGVSVCGYLNPAGLGPVLPTIPAQPADPLEPSPFDPDLMIGVEPGTGPTDPVDPGEGPGLAPPPGGPGMPGPPSIMPTPGESYLISWGDNLLKVTGQAYGVGSGSARFALSKVVNSHPINKSNVDYMMPEVGSSEANWYPPPLGRISFGAPYQVIYFPEVDGY